MSDLAQTAAELAVLRSFYESVVPVIRHGTVTEVNSSTWIHRVQMDGDAHTTQMHDLTNGGAFVGARVTVLFAPPHGGMIMAVNRRQLGWRQWTTAWEGVTTDPVINNGTLFAAAQRRGQSCDINISITFGTTTNGGSGGWSFSLPYPAANDVGEQIFLTKAFTTGGGNWVGFAFVPSGSQIVTPYFPFNSGVSFLGQAQNADATGAAGTGVPLITAQYTWTNGTNFTLTGSYKVSIT